MDTITGQISVNSNIDGGISVMPHMSGDISAVGVRHYSGDYVFTPTQETQYAHTEGSLVGHDIVINPIPNNYGLITWNGSYLTIT